MSRQFSALVLALGLMTTPCLGQGSPDPDEARFRRLFAQWKRQDSAAITPSRRPLVARAIPPGRAGIVVTSGMGMRVNPVLKRPMFHAGADLAAPIGTTVHATADGTVARAGWAGGYGLLVTVQHGAGYETRYAHLSHVLVVPGEAVRRGQSIGTVGSTGRSTGPHLHYEVRRDGTAENPLPFLRSR